MRTVLFPLCLLFQMNQAYATPILIVRTSSDVTLSTDGKQTPVGSVPFPLLDNQQLVVPESGTIVYLTQGASKQIVGPTTFSSKDIQSTTFNQDEDGSFAQMLSKQTSIKHVGATRGMGGVTVTLPVVGSKVKGLQSIEWTCTEECEDTTVSVVNTLTFETLWSDESDGQITYDGPNLTSGSYAVQIGEQYHAFEIPSVEELKTLSESLSVTKQLVATLTKVDQVAVEAAILKQSGFSTDAVYTIQEAIQTNPTSTELKSLLQIYQSAE